MPSNFNKLLSPAPLMFAPRPFRSRNNSAGSDERLREYIIKNIQTQTYRFNCSGTVGDTILITDTEVGSVGHGISEVNIYGIIYEGMIPKNS